MPTGTTERNQNKKGLFVAVDRADNQKVVARGSNVKVTVKRAEQTGKNFTLAYVPPPGKKYFF